MKRPMFFLSADDCGCTPSTPGVAGGTPTVPAGTAAATTICDERYLTLAKANRVQLLGTVPNTSCVAKLDERPGGVAKRGFVISDGTNEGERIEPQPAWDLPLLNPLASGAYPAPSVGFPFLHISTGDLANTPWGFLRAPSTGDYTLGVQGGLFKLLDAGEIPGISGAFTAPAETPLFLTGFNATGDLRKLTALDKRVVVGDGTAGFKSLPDATPLEHPTMKPDTVNVKSFVERDAAGAEYPGGLPLRANTGAEAQLDAKGVLYSPTTKKFYCAPSHTRNVKSVVVTAGNGTLIPSGSGYQTASDGHFQPGLLIFNYPTVDVTWTAKTGSLERMKFALYIDGAIIFEWRYDITSDGNALFQSGTYIATVTPGQHLFEIRVAATTGANRLQHSVLKINTLAD